MTNMPCPLLLLIVLITTAACYQAPTRLEYDEIQDRMRQIRIDRASLPPGDFSLTQCNRYVCRMITDAQSNTGLSCRDAHVRLFGIHDFIFFYFAVEDNSLYIRNTDLDYITMSDLVECLKVEFTTPREKCITDQ